MTPELRAQVIESRRQQGLPPTIEDPVFLSRIAAILLDPEPEPFPGPEPTPLPGEPEVPS